MKKYLISMMVIMSVIYVVPAMAETDSSAISVQSSESEIPNDEAVAETQPVAEQETQNNETLADGQITSMEDRPKEPGEVVEKLQEDESDPSEAVESIAPLAGNRWGLSLNDEEKKLLARITMLESGGESDLGQQAVVEVILNRVYSPAYPNTVYDVLSQVDGGYRQFSTWKSRNSRSASPSARVIANVNAVLNGESGILPYETVYFSQKGANRRVQARIGNHVFCNR